ncbi:autotransporter outer membrane beta-barrel domain-containing protein [Bartonella jaculi]|uniref:Autotransporter domain-containing protein n=1 Tax=Bartonella jaculi TaxID=686226 RepID=A0ABP9N6E6_9HYPH
MISVFANYVFLCIFTTIVLYFLHINHVHASKDLCDSEAEFYTCGDGKKHVFKDKTYHLKSSQEMSPDTTPIAAIYVEGAGTAVDASQITVTGDNSDKISAYGAYVRDGGQLILVDSNFKDIPSLHAQNAVISMTRGSMKGSSHAIYASGKKTDIALVTVNVEIAPDNLHAKGIGIVSGFDAMVRMSDTTVTFNEIGAFLTRFGGRYLLDNMTVNGKGKKESSKVNGIERDVIPEAFEIYQAGDVHLRSSSLQLADMHGFLIKNFSGYLDANGNLIQKNGSLDNFKKTDIKIERSNISVQGEGTYGLYFHLLSPKEFAEILGQNNEQSSEAQTIITGAASVYLKKTNFAVPDGIAIYVTGADGYGAENTIELSEETKVSGDLLLKAENNASISLKADASTLKGGMRAEDVSIVDLQLLHGSTWFLTKRKHKGSQELDSTDSLLSSLSLSDSTLVFDQDVSHGYQTLRIGKEMDRGEIESVDIDKIKGTVIYEGKYKEAYNAQGNVQIKLSTFLDNDGSFVPQKTDRILIYGDVSGTTLVDMQNMQNLKKTSDKKVFEGRDQSISLIQVSGSAQEDSFKLINSYTTVNGFPYQYRLRGYGPSSSFGEADVTQRLVAGEGDFWDFRLEGIYIKPDPIAPTPIDPIPTPSTPISPAPPPSVPSDPVEPRPIDPTPTSSTPISPAPPLSVPSDPVEPRPIDPTPTPSTPVSPAPPPSVPSDPVEPRPIDPTPIPSVPEDPSPVPVEPAIQPEPRIRAVVPQLPTYLLLPNALFQAGFMDLTTQNKKLKTRRSASSRFLKGDEITALFVCGYGGTYHYASNLSAFEYGYGAEFDYNAFEAGVLLKKIESLYSRTFFGLMGTYGNFSLHPQNVEQSKKSRFDKWSVAAYGSQQHDMGFYMDEVFSYGLFRGDVFTLARGKTTTLKGKQLNASMTSGKAFTIGHKGVIFDPQVQLIYQHLQFDRVYDVDNIDVDMGKFAQWTGRIGARLSKTLSTSKIGRIVSFYSTLYFSHSFGDRQFVHFKDAFQLGSFGSSVEAGLGFNARLSAKFALYGDLSYQHKLTKAGFSGVSFSGSLRYRF